ncbi:hypothetical protein ABEF95_016800 [Exophiala dermatitidis]
MANPETFELVKRRLEEIPSLTFQHQSTPYVHAQILSAGEGVAAIPSISAQSMVSAPMDPFPDLISREKRRLLSLDVRDIPFTQFMAVFHELVAIMLACYLDTSQADVVVSDFQKLFDLFMAWSHHFYSVLPEKLDSDLSPWRAWVISESARRTMISIVMIRGIMETVQHGYCYYRPGVESLPFDARTGLWEARTEEEWEAALTMHGGAECSLMSWHEFIESGGPTPRPQYDGMLQRLLLAGHFGKAAQT